MGDEGGLIGILIIFVVIIWILTVIAIVAMFLLYGTSVFYLSKHFYNQTKEKYQLTNKSLLALAGVGVSSFVISAAVFSNVWAIQIAILLFLVLAITTLWAWGVYKLKKTLNPLINTHTNLESQVYDTANEIHNINLRVQQYHNDIEFIKQGSGEQIKEMNQLHVGIKEICSGDRWLALKKDELIKKHGRCSESELKRSLEQVKLNSEEDRNCSLEYLILKLRLLELKIGDPYKIIADKEAEMPLFALRRRDLENRLKNIRKERAEVYEILANKKLEKIVLD